MSLPDLDLKIRDNIPRKEAPTRWSLIVLFLNITGQLHIILLYLVFKWAPVIKDIKYYCKSSEINGNKNGNRTTVATEINLLSWNQGIGDDMMIFQPDLSHPYAQMQTSLGALATHWSNESGSQKMVSIKMCSIILFTVGPSAARRLRLFMRNLRTRRKRKKNLTLSKKCLRVSFICISNNAE